MKKIQVLDKNTKVGFLLCIVSTSPHAPVNYRLEKLRLHLAQHGNFQLDPSPFLREYATVPEPPVAPRQGEVKLSKPVLRQHAARTACALQAIEQETPLLPGEIIEQEEFSYLTAPFHGCPERNALLRRKTNFAELLYLFRGLTVDQSGQLLYEEPVRVHVPARTKKGKPIAVGGMAGDAVSFIAKGIAGGMLSAVGGAIFSGIFDKLFPPVVPDYFGEVYTEMKQIVGGEIQQDTVNHINGAINNVKLMLTNEYGPARKGADLNNPEQRKHLAGLLRGYMATFTSGPDGMLGTLMTDTYGQLGFGAFLIGAGLHLALCQEMANVDDMVDSSGAFPKPRESSYGRPQNGTVALNAIYYAGFANKTWPLIMQARAAKIKNLEKKIAVYVDLSTPTNIAPPSWITNNYAYFSDDLNLTGSKRLPNNGDFVIEYEIADAAKDGSNPIRDRITQDYTTYIGARWVDLTNDFNDPIGIATDWLGLVDNPIKVA